MKKTPSQRGKAARRKGHNYERKTVNQYKELGYSEACTTRYGSKMLDDACVDIMNTPPFNVQCKATAKAVSIKKELDKMPDDANYNILHNKIDRDAFVILREADWYELVQMLKKNNII